MSTADHLNTLSRQNVGPYSVLIHSCAQVLLKTWSSTGQGTTGTVPPVVIETSSRLSRLDQIGTVSSAGLDLDVQLHTARRYRRALMSGVGVYQLSLRAYLTGSGRRSVLAPIEKARALNESLPFLNFKQQAQGRGRITRGPDSGKRVGMLVLWAGISRKARRARKVDALNRVMELSYRMRLEYAGKDPSKGVWRRRKTEREKKEMHRFIANPMRIGLHEFLFPEEETEENPTGANEGRLDDMLSMAAMLERAGTRDRNKRRHFLLTSKDLAYEPYIISYLVLTKNRKALKGLMRSFTAQRMTLVRLVEFLRRAAYRAHLTKRVKPLPRRVRIERPRYARPRPPTAPLAPPAL